MRSCRPTPTPALNGHARDEPSSWQARKSAATRRQVVEATLRCFTKLGYFGTTTPAIAREAGLSRGAMLHHFPTRQDVVRAAVEYLHAKRLKAFRTAVAQLPPGTDRPHAALRAHWEQLSHPLYAVLLELSVAARTDAQLAAVLGPAEAAFVQELQATAREVVPEWRDQGENFYLGYDLVICAMEGMALRMIRNQQAVPERRLQRYLEQRVDELARRPVARAPAPRPRRRN